MGLSSLVLGSLFKGVMGISSIAMIGVGSYKWFKEKKSSPIVEILKSSRVYDEKEFNPVLYRKVMDGMEMLHLKLPAGKSVQDFRDCIPAIQDKLDCEVMMWAEGGAVKVECWYSSLPSFIEYDYSLVEQVRDKSECGIVIGESRRGLRIIDLANPVTSHITIAGGSGGGKSNLGHVILCSLMMTYSPDEVRLCIIDLKDGIEFGIYKDLPHIWRTEDVEGYMEEITEVQNLLLALNRTLQERNRLFKEFGVRNIGEYNFKFSAARIPRIVVFADEIADFTTIGDKKTRDAFYGEWSKILRKGRSAGIHVIFSTQLPDAEVIPRQLKTNLPVRVCFKVPKSENSEVILDDSIAKNLPPIPGRCLMKIANYEYIQVPYLSLDQIEQEIIPRIGGYALLEPSYIYNSEGRAEEKEKIPVLGILN